MVTQALGSLRRQYRIISNVCNLCLTKGVLIAPELECDFGMLRTTVYEVLTENLRTLRVCAKFIQSGIEQTLPSNL